jgi:hypothetical protein
MEKNNRDVVSLPPFYKENNHKSLKNKKKPKKVKFQKSKKNIESSGDFKYDRDIPLKQKIKKNKFFKSMRNRPDTQIGSSFHKNAKITERRNDKSHAYYRGGEMTPITGKFNFDDTKSIEHLDLCSSIRNFIKVFNENKKFKKIPSNTKNKAEDQIDDLGGDGVDIVNQYDKILKNYGMYELFKSFFCSSVVNTEEDKVLYYTMICYGIMDFFKNKLVGRSIVTLSEFFSNIKIFMNPGVVNTGKACTIAFNNMITEAISNYNLYFYDDISAGVPPDSIKEFESGKRSDDFNSKNNAAIFHDDDPLYSEDYIHVKPFSAREDKINHDSISSIKELYEKNAYVFDPPIQYKDKVDSKVFEKIKTKNASFLQFLEESIKPTGTKSSSMTSIGKKILDTSVPTIEKEEEKDVEEGNLSDSHYDDD